MSTDLELPIGQRVQQLWLPIHRQQHRDGVNGAEAKFTAFEWHAFAGSSR